MKSKVFLLPISDYHNDCYPAMRRLFELMDDIRNKFHPGVKVLLKPNLLSARLPEECVTTHPEFIRALIKCLLEYQCDISLGDSPGGYANIDKVYEITGMKALAAEFRIKLVKFEKSKIIDGIPIAEEVFENDIIISLPKFKTHSLTLLTGAVKNCYGFLPGLFKSDCHRRLPRPEEFSRILLKIYKIVNPTLTIVDAIMAMEGEGPAHGIPRKVGLIIAGSDAVSIDSILAYIMGISPYDIYTNKIAEEEKIGVARLADIEIIGYADISQFIQKDFKLPSTSILARIPKPLVGIAGKIIRFYPQIITLKCKGCKICYHSCPVSAITMLKGKARINQRKCILCLCCQEVCPYGAVEVRRNYIARKIGI